MTTSSGSVSLVTKVDIERVSPFMRLPTEVREIIYRPLLIARHVMVEPSMTSEEYNLNRQRIQDGPDQEYHFENAILAVNRRIHEEANDLCRRENDFICLTSRQPSSLGYELESLGLQMIAKRSKAREFWNVSMSLTLDISTFEGWPQDRPWWYREDDWEATSEDGRPWRYIFCCEELPEFCRYLLKIARSDESMLRNSTLYIDINSAIGNGQAINIDSNLAGWTRIQKLLHPLRQLHVLGAARINGPLSASYKSNVIESVCNPCPYAMEIILETSTSLCHADELASRGQLRQANLQYKAALSFVQSCCWRYHEQDDIISGGPFSGLETLQAIHNLEVRLQARIAAVYLKTGKLRMARIYTERAMDPRRPYDDRHNKEYTLDIEPWEHVVYAEILHVSAMISYLHGDVREARDSLEKAGEFVPFTEEQKSRYEAWQGHADRLKEKRVAQEEAKRTQVEKQNAKAEASFQVVCNWKKKGDQLLQSGRSHLASSTYRGALKKLETLNRKHDLDFTLTVSMFPGYCACDAIKALSFKLQAGLAAAGVMSQNYTEVSRLTESALKCNSESHDCRHGCYGGCSLSYWGSQRSWMEDQMVDYLRIRSCRAVSLHHMGDTVGAMELLENAVNLDSDGNTVKPHESRKSSW